MISGKKPQIYATWYINADKEGGWYVQQVVTYLKMYKYNVNRTIIR